MKITIYSTTTCPYCHMLKEWLNEKNIEYKNIMVDEDQKGAEEMVKKSGQMGVPVTIIEKGGKENIVIGFDKEKLSELLDIK
ncbi:glutaredoxin family protein [Candidatus Parcubacteria bacterium]|nr:glutaredoxin family protein [Patescibacteria group bacterium]MCG2694192.1 glutaredoxin family protein [Candidatus Parcubacteria bacterium]